MSQLLGTAYVEVEPDLTSFNRKLSSSLAPSKLRAVGRDAGNAIASGASQGNPFQRLGAGASAAARSVGGANANIARTSKIGKEAITEASLVAGGSFGYLSRRAVQAGVAVSGVWGAFSLIKNAITSTEELGLASQHLADVTGLDVRSASRWIEAAKVRGVASDQLSTSLITLSHGVKGAIDGETKHAALIDQTSAKIDQQTAKAKVAADAQTTLDKQKLDLAIKNGASRQEIAAKILKVSQDETKASRVGTDIAAKGHDALAKQIAKSSGPSADLFKSLGVSAKDLQEGNVEKILLQVSEAFKQMQNPAERAADAQKLFGRSAKDLLPLLIGGRAELLKALGAVDKAHATIGDTKAIEKARAASIQWHLALDGLKLTLGQGLLPALTKALGGLTTWSEQVSGLFQRKDLTGEEKWSKFGDMVQTQIANATPKVLNAAVDIGGKIGAGLVKGFLHAQTWTQIATGAFIVSKLIGWGTIFRGAAGFALKGFASVFLPGMAAEGAAGEAAAAAAASASSIEFGPAGAGAGAAWGATYRVAVAGSAASSTTLAAGEAGAAAGMAEAGALAGSRWAAAFRIAALAATAFIGFEIGKKIANAINQATGGGLSTRTSGQAAAGHFSREDYVVAYEKAGYKKVHLVGKDRVGFTNPYTGKAGTFHVPGYVRGGLIPGQGDGDKVHVMAEPGEGFINKRAVKAMGGKPAIDRINRTMPRFQQGGYVGEWPWKKQVPKEWRDLDPMLGPGNAQAPGYVAGGLVAGGQTTKEREAALKKKPVRGRVSTFGPPIEPAGKTASGRSSAEAGIALYEHDTLGKRFRVAIKGHSAVLPHTDVGPAPFTHRLIDVTGAGARKLGFDPRHFPTHAIGEAQMLAAGGLVKRVVPIPEPSAPTAIARGPAFQAVRTPQDGSKAAKDVPSFITGGAVLRSGYQPGSAGKGPIAGPPRTGAPSGTHHYSGVRVVTASQFVAGPHTASGRVHIPGFAELSHPPESLNFAALGRLPMGEKVSVTYKGRAIAIPKIDVGKGGPGLHGHVRAIDLSMEAARALGFSGLDDVTLGLPVTQESAGAHRGPAGGPSVPRPSRAGASGAGTILGRANYLDSLHLPYVYGGHHGDKGPIKDPRPGLDWSSAVSYVLGVPPRDAAGFRNYGKPGRGRVSLFVKPGAGVNGHVFMNINGRGFGTSQANPGKGPGWLPYNDPKGHGDAAAFLTRHTGTGAGADIPPGLTPGQAYNLAGQYKQPPTLATLLDRQGNRLKANIALAALTPRTTDDRKALLKYLAYARGRLKLARFGSKDPSTGKHIPSTHNQVEIATWAGEVKNTLDEIKALKKDAPPKALFQLGGLSKIGTGPNAFNIASLQGTLDKIDLDVANASRTEAFDKDDVQLPSTLADDQVAAQELVDFWAGIRNITIGNYDPGIFSVSTGDKRIKQLGKPGTIPGKNFYAVKVRGKDYTFQASPGEVITVGGEQMQVPGSHGIQRIPVHGTVKQQTEATTNLHDAEENLRQITDEIKNYKASGATAGFPSENFAVAVEELIRQFASNVRPIQAQPLQSFGDGGIIEGPKGHPVIIKGHGGEAVINEQGDLRVYVKGNDQPPQVIKNVTLNADLHVSKDPHALMKTLAFEAEAA
jgi:hypothetical protein